MMSIEDQEHASRGIFQLDSILTKVPSVSISCCRLSLPQRFSDTPENRFFLALFTSFLVFNVRSIVVSLKMQYIQRFKTSNLF